MNPADASPTPERKREAVKSSCVVTEKDRFTKVETTEASFLHAALKIDVGEDHEPIPLEASISLRFSYRKVDEVEVLFVLASYSGVDYADLRKSQFLFLTDSDETISLSKPSEYNHKSDEAVAWHDEELQLQMDTGDLMKLAKASAIEFSLRTAVGEFSGRLSEVELIYVKGFYNVVFDNTFELDSIYDKLPIVLEQRFKAAREAIKSSEERERIYEETSRETEKVLKDYRKATSGGCFVATAVTGNSDNRIIQGLREFRDDVLAHSQIGKGLIRQYSEIGPGLADIIRRSSLLRYGCLLTIVLPTFLLAETILCVTKRSRTRMRRDGL